MNNARSSLADIDDLLGDRLVGSRFREVACDILTAHK
jgi:hypothetical protein